MYIFDVWFVEYTELTDLLISKINDLPEASTMRFLAYENVAKFYGCEFLLEKFELLPLMLLESIDKPSMTDQVSFVGICLIDWYIFKLEHKNHILFINLMVNPLGAENLSSTARKKF